MLKVKIDISYYTVTISLLDHRLINKIPSARNGLPLSELLINKIHRSSNMTS